MIRRLTKAVASTKAVARTIGAPRYTSTVPCLKGHMTERYTADGTCVLCRRAKNKIRSQKRWSRLSEEKKAAHRARCKIWHSSMTPEQRERKRIVRLESSRRTSGAGPATRIQPEKCELCGDRPTQALDHCHVTGAFRGWLCRRCNVTLGAIGDNLESLTKWTALATIYLNNGRTL